jgi:hypothetical protein
VGIAVISLIVLVVVVIIAILILMRVFGEAAGRNPNQQGDEGSDEPEGDQGTRSGE